MGFIERLQNKPKEVRTAVMWIGVAIFMTIFFVFWVLTIDFDQSSENSVSETQTQINSSVTDIKEEVPSLWQSLKAGVGDVMETATEKIQKEKQEQSQVEVNEAKAKNGSETGEIDKRVPPSKLP